MLKILTWILSILMTLTSISINPFNLFRKSADAIVASIEENSGFASSEWEKIKNCFPPGKYWNHRTSNGEIDYETYNKNRTHYNDRTTDIACTTHGGCCSPYDYSGECGCNSFGSSTQCMGFAKYVGFKLFGDSPKGNGDADNNWISTSFDNLKPGDYIRYKTSASHEGHSVIVVEKNDNEITVLECNKEGGCKIGWGRSITRQTLSRYYSVKCLTHVNNMYSASSEQYEKDTSFSCPFRAYPASTTTVSTYNSSLIVESGRWIDSVDECTILTVFTNGYCRLSYPSSSGTRIAYAKLSDFIPSGISHYSYSPASVMDTYSRADKIAKYGSVSPTDNCTVVGKSGTCLQILYPLYSGGFKLGWIETDASTVPPQTQYISTSMDVGTVSGREAYIQNYLATEFFPNNTAAVAGAMANLKAENSNFNPNLIEGSYTWENGGGYGLVQWTNSNRGSSGRRSNLAAYYKNQHGLDITTASGRNSISTEKHLQVQLEFLKNELNGSGYKRVWDYLKTVPNTPEGAYLATAYWCIYFETPGDTSFRVFQRGCSCLNSYYNISKNSAYDFGGNTFGSSAWQSYCLEKIGYTGANGRDAFINDYRVPSGSLQNRYLNVWLFFLMRSGMPNTYSQKEGSIIRWGQYYLGALGYFTDSNLGDTGCCFTEKYGPLTQASIANFQQYLGLTITKTITAETQNKILSMVTGKGVAPQDQAQCQISFNLNGGEGVFSTQSVAMGSQYVIPAETPTRTGYSFSGWKSSVSGNAFFMPGDRMNVTSSVTLTANWSALQSYTITYNANGGTGAPKPTIKYAGEAVTISTVIPSRPGYYFIGWSAISEHGAIAYSSGDQYTLDEDLDLRAKWTTVSKFHDVTATRISGMQYDISFILDIAEMVNADVKAGFYSDRKQLISSSQFKNVIVGNKEMIHITVPTSAYYVVLYAFEPNSHKPIAESVQLPCKDLDNYGGFAVSHPSYGDMLNKDTTLLYNGDAYLTLTVHTSAAWHLAYSDNWIVYNNTENHGSYETVRFFLKGNTEIKDRKGVIKFLVEDKEYFVYLTQPHASWFEVRSDQFGSLLQQTITLSNGMQGTEQCIVVASDVWKIRSDSEWLTFDVVLGNQGETAVQMRFAENDTSSTRIATVTATCEGKSYSFSVNQPDAYAFAVSHPIYGDMLANEIALTYGDDSPFTLTVDSANAWSVTSPDSWIHITNTTGEAGTVICQTTLDGNRTTETRTGTIVFQSAGKTYHVLLAQPSVHYVTISNPNYGNLLDGTVLLTYASDAYLTMQISSSSAWTAISKADWIQPLAKSGIAGNSECVLYLNGNTGKTERVGKIQIVVDDILYTVTLQQPSAAYFSATHPEYGDLLRSVTMNTSNDAYLTMDIDSGMSWTAETNVDWLSVIGATSGVSGKTQLKLYLKGNTTAEERTGMVVFSVGGYTYVSTIIQPRGEAVFAVSHQEYGDLIGTTTLNLSGESILTMTIVSNNAWTATKDVSWITFETLAEGSGNGELKLRFDGNTTSSVRTGKVTFTSAGKSYAAVIRQPGEDAFFTATHKDYGNLIGDTTLTQSAEAVLTMTITSNNAWSAIKDAEWITFETAASGSGNGQLRLRLAGNATGSIRTGKVTFTSGGETYVATLYQPSEEIVFKATHKDYGNLVGTTTLSQSGESILTLTITSNTSWSASKDATWISFESASSGTGNGEVKLHLAANESGDVRTGTVTFNCGVKTFAVVLRQPKEETIFSATHPEYGNLIKTTELTQTGESILTMTIASNSAWTATSNVAWITFDTTPSGSGDGTLKVHFAGNTTDSARTGTVTFTCGGKTYKAVLKQPGEAVFSATHPEYGNLIKTTELTQTGESILTMTIASNSAWTATSDVAWITFDTTPSGSGDGTLKVHFVGNTTDSARTGTVTFTCGGKTYKAVLKQPRVEPIFKVTHPDYGDMIGTKTLSQYGAAYLTLTIESTHAWTATKSVSWISFETTASGSGDGTLKLYLKGNTTGSTRTGTLTFSSNGTKYTVKLKQPSAPPFTVSHPDYGDMTDSTTTLSQTGASYLTLTIDSPASWTAKKSGSWISFQTTASGSEGTSQLKLYLTGNTTGSTRTGTITFTCDGIEYVVKIKQPSEELPTTFEVKHPTYGDLLASTVVLTQSGGAYLTMTINSSDSWTASTSSSWISFDTTASGSSGSSQLRIYLNGNTTGYMRQGKIKFSSGGKTYTVTLNQPSD